MQELGPMQTQWIEALESGKYPQTTEVLHDDKGYCCLGVAAEIFGLRNIHNHVLATIDANKLGLRSAHGIALNVDQLFESPSFVSLSVMNDSGMTFKDIAAELRRDPNRYFSEPK